MSLDKAIEAYKSGNYELALSEFEPADATDKAEAMFYLGLMYDKGLGVLKDSRKAAELFHQSAQGGYGRACNAIGICYRDGDGVEKDVESAKRWFEAGAQLNIAACYKNLGYIYNNNKQYEKSYSYWQKAADLGDLYCHRGIASLYLHGHGVQPDGVKALEHYAKAQTKDNNTAYGMICVLEKYGLPDGYDPDMIVSYARTAIDNNIITDGTILLRLGRIYQGLKFHNLKGLRPVVGKASGVDVGYIYSSYVGSVSSYQVGGSVQVTGGGTRTSRDKITSAFIDTTPTEKSYQIFMPGIHVEDLKNGIDVCGLVGSESKPILDVGGNKVLYFYLPNSNIGAKHSNLFKYLDAINLSNEADDDMNYKFVSIINKIMSNRVYLIITATVISIILFPAIEFNLNLGTAAIMFIVFCLFVLFTVFVLLTVFRVAKERKRITRRKTLREIRIKGELDRIMAYAFGDVGTIDHYTCP